MTIERQEIEMFVKRCKKFDNKEFTMIDRVSKKVFVLQKYLNI